MMTTPGSSSSLSHCTRRSRSFEFPDENGDRKFKELEKSKSFPASRRTKSSNFNFRAKIEDAKIWMLQWTTLYATFQLKFKVEFKNDDATTQEELQPLKNAQADSHLTNERTSNGTEDTSPIDRTHAHDEDGFGARQPLRLQQNLQNTHWTLALTYERLASVMNNCQCRDKHRRIISVVNNRRCRDKHRRLIMVVNNRRCRDKHRRLISVINNRRCRDKHRRLISVINNRRCRDKRRRLILVIKNRQCRDKHHIMLSGTCAQFVIGHLMKTAIYPTAICPWS